MHDLPLLPALGLVVCWRVVQPIQNRAAEALRGLHLRTWNGRMIDALLLDMLYSGLGALSGAVVLYGLMWLADWP